MTFSGASGKHDMLSLLVAIMAVLLSQVPPVYQWFYEPELEFRVPPSFDVAPSLYSGFSIMKHYSITNIGEKRARIKSMHLFISDTEGNLLYESSASRFRLHGTPNMGLMLLDSWEAFSEINLNPNENWTHEVAFEKRLTGFELDGVRGIQARVDEERYDWELEMEEAGVNLYSDDAPMFEVSEELNEETAREIRAKVAWFSEGEYRIHAAFIGDDVHVKTYAFVVRPYQIRRFALSLDSLSDGSGYDTFLSTSFDIELNTEEIARPVEERLESMGSQHIRIE